ARKLAAGVEFTLAQALCLEMLAPVMTMREGARMYAPNGTLLGEGETLRQPGLGRALEVLADEGAGSVYSGTIARELLALIEEREGTITAGDLAAYRAEWTE